MFLGNVIYCLLEQIGELIHIHMMIIGRFITGMGSGRHLLKWGGGESLPIRAGSIFRDFDPDVDFAKSGDSKFRFRPITSLGPPR